MGSLEQIASKMTNESSTVVRFCLGSSAEEEQQSLLESQLPAAGAETPDSTQRVILLPKIVISDGERRDDQNSNTSRDPKQLNTVMGWQDNTSYIGDREPGNESNNADTAATESKPSRKTLNGAPKASTVTFKTSDNLCQEQDGESTQSSRPVPFGQWRNRIRTKGLREMRKYSLPSKLLSEDEESNFLAGLKPTLSGTELELKHRHSVFGDLCTDTVIGASVSKQSYDSGFKSQIFSFFQASDNKLAMKLFGSKSALLKEKRRQQAANTWIIHPCSNFRLYWDLLMLIFLVTNLIVLPVAIAFFFNDIGAHWIVFNVTCDVLFFLDILINFRTGLIDPQSHGEVILDPKVISIKYLKGWFIVDMMSSLPLDYLFLLLEGELYAASRAIKILRLAKILQLLRLLRISRLVRYIRIWQEYFSLASIVMRIFNLTCVMVLLSHWSGCIQFAVPVFQGWPEDSWISIENLQKAHWWDQYTRSLFKALSHMLCIGYGQYPPRNITETWLTIASMLSGATCYALFVGHATALIQSFDTSSRQFRDHLLEVNEYMSYRKLPQLLRQRVTSYYNHRFGGKMFNEQMILAELSDTLRKDIINHNCKELIQTVPFFLNADENFVDEVIMKLEFETFQCGDLVVRANTVGHKMFFIQEGVVEVIGDDGGVVTRLADGSYFGEISLLTKQPRVATVRAASNCNLFSLSKNHFDNILACYPVMRRTLETIAAQRLRHLGKEPSLLTSRESLLDDIEGFQKAMQVHPELQSDDEEQTTLSDDAGSSQFLTTVKGFFTKDSDNYSVRARVTSRSPSPRRSMRNSNNNTMPRSKSSLQYLIAPTIVPLSRRVQSSSQIDTPTHRTNTVGGVSQGYNTGSNSIKDGMRSRSLSIQNLSSGGISNGVITENSLGSENTAKAASFTSIQ